MKNEISGLRSRTKASQHCTPMCAHTFGRDCPAFDLPQPAAVNLLLSQKRAETTSMILWAIFVILLLLWLVGVVISYTMGGFIHIFLVAAVVALIFQITSDRRTAP